MKKAIRIFTFALLSAMLLSLSIPALAAEENVEAEKAIASNDTLPAEAVEASTVNENNANTAEEENGFFAELFYAFEVHASEILSAFAFIGSVIIMLCYKKGLLPIINDGLKALKSGIKAINEKSESFNEHAINLCDSIDSRLEHAEQLAEAVLKSAESVEDELDKIHKQSAENEKLKIILAAQIDMLYEIFMSASLPQYLKDSVGEKIGEMKSALGKEAEENEFA